MNFFLLFNIFLIGVTDGKSNTTTDFFCSLISCPPGTICDVSRWFPRCIEPIPEPPQTCDDLFCAIGATCAMVWPARCHHRWCKPEPQCHEVNNCHSKKCRSNEECVLVQRSCHGPPCYPRAECRLNLTTTSSPAPNMTTTESGVCLCSTLAGCAMVKPMFCGDFEDETDCPLQLVCVETNNCTTTICEEGTECVLHEVPCLELPCNPIAKCDFPATTTENLQTNGFTQSLQNNGTTSSLQNNETTQSVPINGTTVSLQNNGTTVSLQNNGTTVNLQNNGTTVSVQTTTTQGLRINGTTLLNHRANRSGQTNGTTESVRINGTTESVRINGTTESSKINGTTQSVQTDGTTESDQTDETTESWQTDEPNCFSINCTAPTECHTVRPLSCGNETDCPLEPRCILENPCELIGCPDEEFCFLHDVNCTQPPCKPIGVCESLPTDPMPINGNQCKENETFTSCMTDCSDTECNKEPQTCPDVCIGTGCVCQEGYFRDEEDNCVTQKDCDIVKGVTPP